MTRWAFALLLALTACAAEPVQVDHVTPPTNSVEQTLPSYIDDPSYIDGYRAGVRLAQDFTLGSDPEYACQQLSDFIATNPAPGLDLELGYEGCLDGFYDAS